MIQRRREFLQTLAFASTMFPSTSQASDPVSIDVGRQLFVDDYLLESTTLKRTSHKPKLYSDNPVLRPETALELNHGVMPAAAPFSDGAWYDPKDNLFKLWYIGGYDDGTCLVTSEDGIHWIRPSLDVVPGTNRVIAPVHNHVRNGSTLWLDHEATDPNERFKLFIYQRRGTGTWPRKQPAEPLSPGTPANYANVFTSPDGIHWGKPMTTGPCGDNSGFFYNPFRKKWVFSIRTQRPGVGRVRSYYETEDFMKGAAWTAADVHDWLACDDKDVPDPVLKRKPELYKVDCVGYESRILGLFSIYLGPPNAVAYKLGIPKTNDIHVGFSRDGLEFERRDRTPFIACSREPGTWSRGYFQPAGACCLVVGDEIRFYFAAFSGISPALGGCSYAGASTGLATLRRDGFFSLDSEQASGTVTTRPVTFRGRYLFTNVAAQDGELRAEVLNASGRVIAPFSMADCLPVKVDATKQAVAWKKAKDLKGLIGKPVKFRFQLTGGQLYSFWVSPDAHGASYGYVGGGGPGFTGYTDTTGA